MASSILVSLDYMSPLRGRGLEFRRIASYKTVAALPKDNPLTNKTTVDLKGLAPTFSSERPKRAIQAIANG